MFALPGKYATVAVIGSFLGSFRFAINETEQFFAKCNSCPHIFRYGGSQVLPRIVPAVDGQTPEIELYRLHVLLLKHQVICLLESLLVLTLKCDLRCILGFDILIRDIGSSVG